MTAGAGRDRTPGAVPPLAEAIGVSKRFGSTVALADARLAVLPGESHALVGRNGAGKSTLVNVLTGIFPPDTGEIRFDGQPAPAPGDRGAWQSRVACVYQKSTIIPGLTVAENLFLNRQPGRGGVIGWARMRREARDLLETWDIRVDPAAAAGDLTVQDRQFVEIARALSFGARFIILDEPTAQLDNAEIERLFTRMRELQEAGVTFLFISHHLQEVYEVCQTVTVFRDARWITTRPVAELPRAALVEAMTGEAAELGRSTGHRQPVQAPVRLEVDGLTAGDGTYENVRFTVRRGEVVGLAGSSAGGKIELAETLAGLRRPESGTATLDGAALPFGDVRRAMAAGVGFVPRDRHAQGLVAGLSVGENATMTAASLGGRGTGDRDGIRDLGPLGVIGPRRMRAAASAAIRELDIKTTGPEQPVNGLSGGNQQKVVLARALAVDPRLLILINPTAGVDVKSKEALLGVVDEIRERGTSVIIISDELDDLRPCDRVLVFFHGRVTAEHAAGWSDHEMVASIEGVSQ
ncbi:sugar ABC transporter ATP-binding protein [Actinomadura sp. GC306]|uniref:sugar ABC transporter ATP-binding protein n=1 Tax=Actinomadura sp. GC306 TaxID=2530367 RepID=UPI001051B1A8|nr:sugar ABC transporter ATP-binding protein [Actinomadura sp. GC306]TDC69353.1 sugar ABC transporter ATP-binding protein [Actinomadura sp. GC306]